MRLIAAALLSLLLLPATAFAGAVRSEIVEPGYGASPFHELSFRDDSPAFERNDLVMRVESGRAIVTDRAHALTVGPGCDAIDANTASCAFPAAGRTNVVAGGGDDSIDSTLPDGYFDGGGGDDDIAALGRLVGAVGSDTLILRGGESDGSSGNDLLMVATGVTGARLTGAEGDDIVLGGIGDDARVDGGPGNDFVRGGPGNDLVAGGFGRDILDAGKGDDRLESASDLFIDRVRCGDGVDEANRDRADRISGCERRVIGRLAPPDSSLRVDRNGRALSLTYTCAANDLQPSPFPCRGGVAVALRRGKRFRIIGAGPIHCRKECATGIAAFRLPVAAARRARLRIRITTLLGGSVSAGAFPVTQTVVVRR